jgi:hypothetical protein
MSDDSYIIRQLKGFDRRLGQTEVKEVPRDVSARVYNDANISIANNTVVILTFNQERYDTDSIHSISVNTSRFTIPFAGKYAVGAHVGFASNATGYRQVGLLLNGVTNIAIQNYPAVNGDATAFSIATEYDFPAGVFVEVYAYQNSGGPLNVIVSNNWTPEFWIRKMS